MNNLNHAPIVGRAVMKNDVTFKVAKEVKPGDVVVDRLGNEMVIIEVSEEHPGECLALFNGIIKRINTSRVSMVIQRAQLNE